MPASNQPPLFQRQDDDKTHMDSMRSTTTTNQPPLFQQHDDHNMRGAASHAALREPQRTLTYEWQPPRDRPTGVTIIALLLGGISVLLGGLAVLVLGELGGYAIVALPLLALNVWVAVGLWRMRGWARLAAIVLYGVNAAFALVSAFANGLTVEGVVTFVVSLVIIYYLTRPHVAEAFE